MPYREEEGRRPPRACAPGGGALIVAPWGRGFAALPVPNEALCRRVPCAHPLSAGGGLRPSRRGAGGGKWGSRTPRVSMVTRARRAVFAYWRRAGRDVIAAPRRERRPAPFGPPTNQRRRTAPPGQSVVRRREGGAPLGRSLPSSPHGGRRSGRIAARSGAGMSYKPIAPAPSASPAPGPAATAAGERSPRGAANRG